LPAAATLFNLNYAIFLDSECASVLQIVGAKQHLSNAVGFEFYFLLH